MAPDRRPHDVEVLLVAYTPQRGAVAELFQAFAASLSATTSVAVLAPDNLTIHAEGLVADIRFPYSTRQPFRALIGKGWRAHRTAARLAPTVVLLFTQHPLNFVTAAHLRRSRVAFWWHEPALRGQVSRGKAFVYRIHDAIVAPLSSSILVAAPSVAAQVPGRYRDKVTVVPFPALVEFDIASSRFAGSPVDLVYFGKLARYKGLDVLAQALRVLDDRGRNPTLRIVGAGALASAAPAMAAYLASHPDRVDHVAEYVSAADIGSAIESARTVVLPYLSAAGSSTLAIAGQHRAAIVASRTGAFADYLEHGVSALLAEPGDPVQLADQIERVLDDEPLRRSLGSGSHSLATTEFESLSCAERLLKAIKVSG